MAVPGFQKFMLPFLKYLSDGIEHSIRELREHIAAVFELSEEDRKELLKSGGRVFDNRVYWTRTYLAKAGLVESTGKGTFKITKRGIDVLSESPEHIDIKFLDRYPEFVEFHKAKKKPTGTQVETDTSEKTAQEALEEGYALIRRDLAQELIELIKTCSPEFFETLVIDVLLKMGYGGSREDAGKAVGRGGDGGIDGVINEDRLGLDVIYIQAKRWKDELTVGRPEIQKFVGALHGRKARKGIFITTSSFTKDARDYAANIENKVILIDGPQLAELMIDFNVGVSSIASYEIKRIDADYFLEDK